MSTIAARETVAAALARGRAALAAAGIDSPAREARLLLAAASGLGPEAQLRAPDRPVGPGFDALLARRLRREPLALILGAREFWSLSFAVSTATLVPRPDSEALIEAARIVRPERGEVHRVLDLGTGTGCLLLAALSEFSGAFGIGIDRSPSAACLARTNAAALGLSARAAFLAGNWAEAISGRFDLVLANPPYIRSGEIAGLAPEIADFEPRSALDGGEDGLAAYREIIPAIAGLLAPAGIAVIELGLGQLGAVAALATGAGLRVVHCQADLAGIPRALCLGGDEKTVWQDLAARIG